MRNFCDSHPLSLKEGGHLQFVNQMPEDRRTVNDPLILQVTGQVDAIVFTDVLHGLRGQKPGMREDSHRIEDTPPRLDIPAEGTFRDTGQFGQFFLADEFVFVVEVNHNNWG